MVKFHTPKAPVHKVSKTPVHKVAKTPVHKVAKTPVHKVVKTHAPARTPSGPLGQIGRFHSTH